MTSGSRALVGPQTGSVCQTPHPNPHFLSLFSSSVLGPKNHALLVGLKISLSHVMACGTDKALVLTRPQKNEEISAWVGGSDYLSLVLRVRKGGRMKDLAPSLFFLRKTVIRSL